MVKKLIKHELIALFRTLVWLMGAVLLLGVLARICLELGVSKSTEDFSLSVVFVMIFWVFSVMALLFSAVVLSVARYFQSLFTGEGYLTFSLPVTPTQLLVGKFLSALIASVACFVVIVLSILVAIPSYLWTSIFETNVFGTLFSYLGSLLSSDPLSVLEFVLMGIASIPAGLLYLYLVASIGQLFTKGRVAITIVLYYGVSFVLSFVLNLLPMSLMDALVAVPHLMPWLEIIALIGFDIGSFFIIRYILLHKVNLVV